MNKKLCMALLCLIVNAVCHAQQLYFPKTSASDTDAITAQVPVLANHILLKLPQTGKKNDLDDLFRLQILSGHYADAVKTIGKFRDLSKSDGLQHTDLLLVQYELFARAKLEQGSAFDNAFEALTDNLFKSLDDKAVFRIYSGFFTYTGADAYRDDVQKAVSEAGKKDSISMNDALGICRSYFLWDVFKKIEPIGLKLTKQDEHRRYIIENALIKTKDGAIISAIIVRRRNVPGPQPVVLQYTIYADGEENFRLAEPATYGYTSVLAYSRGKRYSPDKIVPFEPDGSDANDVIDWISKQAWCNGKIGMYGGSYNGFTQWAAAKYHHPALKTIVPYVAAIPGQGLPMENNVFLTANYGWNFYTTNDRYLDNKTYNNPKRWNNLPDNWFASGVPYRKIDSIDGTPNPWLQKYLDHPAYDSYWQKQVPYKADFAKINIPVLVFDGYYDDGQAASIQCFKDHLKYNLKADDYLVLGPYDHFGTQRGGDAVLRGYTVDPVAIIHIRDITFQWLDYILKGGKKPEILKDKVNFEVMGANEWRHVPSIAKMANRSLKLYLTNVKQGDNFILSENKPLKPGALNQTVDFADRKTLNNNEYYPVPIIRKTLDRSTGLFFITKPFDKPVSVNGMFSGVLKAIINKKDMDVGLTLYELMPDGRYFSLAYFLGRASYAHNITTRQLLHPGKVETIPFSRSRMVSRQLSKGSRLLVVLDINKNSSAQVNYGTGKDVSTESIKDAGEPLKIWWKNNSYINVPVME